MLLKPSWQRVVFARLAAVLVALAVALTATRTARAEGIVALDLGVALPRGDMTLDTAAGIAVRGRLGLRLPNFSSEVPLYFTPELRGGYVWFFPRDVESIDYGAVQLTGGGRLAYDAILSPAIHGGIGFARMSGTHQAATFDRDSFAYLVGVALDYTAVPMVDFGAHAQYSHMTHEEESRHRVRFFHWAEVGLHVAAVF